MKPIMALKSDDDLIVVRCSIGSWSYSGNDVKLAVQGSDALDLTYYNGNCPLAVESHEAKVVSHTYPCCEESYPSMDISIVFNERE